MAARALKISGGRSSWNGTTATVFGATGFMGRYVVSKLGAVGCRVVLPYRGDELYTRHLKQMGDLGAMNPLPITIRSLTDIETAVGDSSIVINLLGKHYETSRWKFDDVNATFPSVLAEVCAHQGVERLVHVSALAAAVDSPSAWARSKAVGERAVMQAMPSATILRPGPVCGDEDRLLNRLAKFSRMLPFMPLYGGGVARQQPVHVNDVADAIVAVLKDPATAGQSYSLGGSRAYSYKELTDIVFKIIDDHPQVVSVPESFGLAFAKGMQLLPDPWFTVDDFRLQMTDVLVPEGAAGLADLGITSPLDIAVEAERYLCRFRMKSEFIGDMSTFIRPPGAGS